MDSSLAAIRDERRGGTKEGRDEGGGSRGAVSGGER